VLHALLFPFSFVISVSPLSTYDRGSQYRKDREDCSPITWKTRMKYLRVDTAQSMQMKSSLLPHVPLSY